MDFSLLRNIIRRYVRARRLSTCLNCGSVCAHAKTHHACYLSVIASDIQCGLPRPLGWALTEWWTLFCNDKQSLHLHWQAIDLGASMFLWSWIGKVPVATDAEMAGVCVELKLTWLAHFSCFSELQHWCILNRLVCCGHKSQSAYCWLEKSCALCSCSLRLLPHTVSCIQFPPVKLVQQGHTINFNPGCRGLQERACRNTLQNEEIHDS